MSEEKTITFLFCSSCKIGKPMDEGDWILTQISFGQFSKPTKAQVWICSGCIKDAQDKERKDQQRGLYTVGGSIAGS